MSTEPEPETLVVATGMETSTRLRRWAARRAGQLLRVVLASIFVLTCGVVGVLVWRSASLMGLPDVGDPFDLASAGTAGDTDERDAFVLFRRARSILRPMPDLPLSMTVAGPIAGWSKANPKLQRWVESNGEAMELFRRAAAQPDGIAHPVRGESAFLPHQVILTPFVWLALLEGCRLEERGDMAEAWGWYRTLLETRAHLMRRGTGFERLFLESKDPWIRRRIAAWAADPRTGVPDLRRALDDANRTRPRPEWDASSLMVDYVLAMRELDRPDGLLVSGFDDDLSFRIGGEALPPDLAKSVHGARRFVHNEPERSRRVLRLIYANWLAHIEDLADSRRNPAVRAIYRNGQPTSVVLYASGPTAPPPARALAPPDLAAWLFKAHDAKRLLFECPWPAIGVQERQHHRALLMLLAGELYRRERGGPPPSDEALVGAYLEGLPDDGTADLDDGTTRTIEEPQPRRASLDEDGSP